MKVLNTFFLFVFIFLGCEELITEENGLRDISFTTDKASYTSVDTIYFQVDNRTDTSYTIALRCGRHLEMAFQKKENGIWSDDLLFSYMYLKCPTFIDSIKSGASFKSSLTPELFESAGTFRLILNNTVISNTFQIRRSRI